MAPLFLLLAAATFSLSGAVQYRYLRALPASGVYNPGGVYTEYLRAMRLKCQLDIEDGFVKADRATLPSFFLAPTKLVAETMTDDVTESECEVDDEGAPVLSVPYCRSILRNIVPVPIRSSRDSEIGTSLTAALMASSQAATGSGSSSSINANANANANINKNSYSWKGAVITDRDKGIYDSLAPFYTKWLGISNGGKRVYDQMRNMGSSAANPSPYHCFLSTIDDTLGLKVTGILLEVADSPNAAVLSLGAACLVAKKDSAKEWILTKANYNALVKEAARPSADAKLLDCHLDEAMGLHFATNIPICISDSLYQVILPSLY